jgi:hypothetical protein
LKINGLLGLPVKKAKIETYKNQPLRAMGWVSVVVMGADVKAGPHLAVCA